MSTSLPPESKGVIVACQKGLRSLAACERLANAGYGKIAWLNGGYDMSTKVRAVRFTADKDGWVERMNTYISVRVNADECRYCIHARC